MPSAILALIAASPLAAAAAAATAAVAATLAPAAAALPHAAGQVAPQAAATLSPEQAAALANYAHAAPQSTFAAHFPWLTRIFAGLFVFASILMVALLAIQTTKQEGLGSSVGGTNSNYRRRPGREQQIAGLTTFAAILFVIAATAVGLSGF